MVAAASTVTAAFARKLHTTFACKGSDYGGGGGGGVMVVVVGGGRIIAGQDSCFAATALLIGAPWSCWMDFLPGAEIPRARRWR